MIYTADELIDLSQAYMAGTGASFTWLGTAAAGNNRLFQRLIAGFDCRTQAAERASDWFDAHWPRSVPWPSTVRRRRRVA